MEIEKNVVKEIWCEILGMDQIEDEDKFYDLGGNSIMMLLIIDKVKEKYQVELPVTDFEQFDSVSDMTKYISKIA